MDFYEFGMLFYFRYSKSLKNCPSVQLCVYVQVHQHDTASLISCIHRILIDERATIAQLIFIFRSTCFKAVSCFNNRSGKWRF